MKVISERIYYPVGNLDECLSIPTDINGNASSECRIEVTSDITSLHVYGVFNREGTFQLNAINVATYDLVDNLNLKGYYSVDVEGLSALKINGQAETAVCVKFIG